MLQANGLHEHFNQMLQQMLVKFASEKHDRWDEFLDSCIFAYNTAVQESAHFLPLEVMFGRKATLPIDLDMAQQQPKDKVIENF